MTIDIDAVMAALTLEQKVSLLGGHDTWHTATLPGVPAIRCSDGPAGVRGTKWNGPASASFPCATALGASFDPALVEAVGAAIGREARSKSAHVLLAPTVNLHRTPIGGRNFECMSEDPLLTARIAGAYIRGVQSEGVACCIKHFVANDTEYERHSISSEVDPVTLREAYLLPFEQAVSAVADGGAGVRALMSSYNRVNGVYASEHPELLRHVLRDEWGFDGVVISDWFGTHTAAESLEASLDLEMPGPPRERGDALLAAVRDGRTTEARVDESVRRLLRLADWSGAGDGDGSERTDDSPETRAIIRRAAIAGTVLLKNEGGVLPLAGSSRIALLGPNAARGQVQGGGSAQVRVQRASNPLVALQQRGVELVHEPGCSIEKRLRAMRGTFHLQYEDTAGNRAQDTVDRLSFLWMEAPGNGIDRSDFRLTARGTFVPDVTGDWQIGLTVVGPCVLRIDGEVVIDLSTPQTGGAFFGLGNDEVRATVACEAGVVRAVEVEMGHVERGQVRGLLVGAASPVLVDAMASAVAAAAAADVAVVVVGTSSDWETEGEDRTTLALPGDQDALVAQVAAVNPRTIVVVNAGSPVAMPWLDDVAAVMQVWFPGEEFGEALADILLGIAEPGGRLPVTLPHRLEDTPAFAHYPGRDGMMDYAEGLLIGHRWYDATGVEPLFPFGHGLGYTTWELESATVGGAIDGGVTLTTTVRNTGTREGSTVVQCYVEPPTVQGIASVPQRPVRTLRGFAKVVAGPGTTASATIRLDRRAFSQWDEATRAWIVSAGDHRIVAGFSSRSLQLAGECPAPAGG